MGCAMGSKDVALRGFRISMLFRAWTIGFGFEAPASTTSRIWTSIYPGGPSR